MSTSKPRPTSESRRHQRRRIMRRLAVLNDAQDAMRRLWAGGDPDALPEAEALAQRLDAHGERLAELHLQDKADKQR